MPRTQPLVHDSFSGASYLLRGFSLIRQKGIRRYVILPLCINFMLFITAFSWLFYQFSYFLNWFDSLLPQWLTWLNYLLWPLAVVTILVVFSFLFTTVANWIAAPFNGLLAEKVERHLTGHTFDEGSIWDFARDLPRTFGREWKKLCYFLPRLLGCLILSFIPVIGQTAGPVVWFMFNAWMMSVQYCDYPFDNHKIDFITMRKTLTQRRGKTLSFGALTLLLSSVPFLNLLIMPVAVCGATALWVDHYRNNTPQTP